MVMIAWMQKHNKYLVVTIWIATIAFIGAGFVGWGSYKYGKKAESIAQVGDVEISQSKFDFTYRNLYREYNDLFKGQFDEAKAKEIGLVKKVFDTLVMQAYLLNLANEYGIVVSERELADYIASLPTFQNGGVFSREIYDAYLQNNAMKAKNFEAILRDDIRISKLMKLLSADAVKYEAKILSMALSVSDKLQYTVLDASNIDGNLSDGELESYWKKHKSEYMSAKKYRLSLVETHLDDMNVSVEELKKFYDKNSYNYTDADGKVMDFASAKSLVEKDYRIKKGKKRALLDYIAFKKGKRSADRVVLLPENDATLSRALWNEIRNAEIGSIVKPKAIDDRYVTLRLEEVVEPKIMDFNEAKERVEKDLGEIVVRKRLDEKAREYLESDGRFDKESNFVSLRNPQVLPPLSEKETLQFLQKLFTSNKQKGMITLSDKRIVYRIVDQKIGERDENLSMLVKKSAGRIKKGEFEERLIEELSSKYTVKKFVKGI